jgi:hypothetical protein
MRVNSLYSDSLVIFGYPVKYVLTPPARHGIIVCDPERATRAWHGCAGYGGGAQEAGSGQPLSQAVRCAPPLFLCGTRRRPERGKEGHEIHAS